LQVFATAAFGEIRVWHITTCRELLRVQVPNLDCRCLAFSADGIALLSGWDDGTLRAFGPQSGKALWTVSAHHKPVTAVAGCPDGERLISGGEDGMVRVWQARPPAAALHALCMKRQTPVRCMGDWHLAGRQTCGKWSRTWIDRASSMLHRTAARARRLRAARRRWSRA
jgi:cilia- and flagella-associated protein 52